MQESDTYLMILEEGMQQQAKRAILLFGEEKVGLPDESVKTQLNNINDIERLNRMIRCAAKGTCWQEILDTP